MRAKQKEHRPYKFTELPPKEWVSHEDAAYYDRGGPETGDYFGVRVVFFTDLHAHEWQKGLTDKDRLGEVLETVEETYKVAAQYDADYVVFGGDLFESKRSVPLTVAARTYEAMVAASRRFSDSTFRLDATTRRYEQWSSGMRRPGFSRASSIRRKTTIILTGNHDVVEGVRRHGSETSLAPLQAMTGCLVFQRAEVVGLGPGGVLPVLLFPHEGYKTYNEHDNFHKSATRMWHRAIGFSHAPVVGAPVRPGLVDPLRHATAGYRPCDLFPRLVFQGHYHHPFRMDYRAPATGRVTEVVGAGSPLQHDWSDVDSPNDRGCVVIEARMRRRKLAHVTYQKIVFANYTRFASAPVVTADGDADDLVVLPPDVTASSGMAVDARTPLARTYDPRAMAEEYVRARLGDAGMIGGTAARERERLTRLGVGLMTGREEQ